MSSNKLVIGLTGGIGSGKSTVADLFADRGVDVIDTDRIARELTDPGQPAYHAIVEKFGRYVVMGNTHLNRKTLRKYIFSDDSLRVWLEQLLHPLIRQELARRIAASEAPYCMAVIPLLFENEINPLITRTLVVDVPEEVQLTRTQLRDMNTPEEVEAIMKSQVTREKRLGSADDVIYNDKKIQDLIPQVEKLHASYLALVGNSG
ncbi:MAG: dephospho-CoA kinase [Gammaproteobacteria bacterium]|nr:dephospho-CoA kinase [Gammaproteobacteria bacterium]